MPRLRRPALSPLDSPRLFPIGIGIILLCLLIAAATLVNRSAQAYMSQQVQETPRIIAVDKLNQITRNSEHPEYPELFRQPLALEGVADYIGPRHPWRRLHPYYAFRTLLGKETPRPPLRLLMDTDDPGRKIECRISPRQPLQEYRLKALTEMPQPTAIQGLLRGQNEHKIVLSPCFIAFSF